MLDADGPVKYLQVSGVRVVHEAVRFMVTLQVIDGFQVVKAMEAVGSSSGDTAFDVIIAHCGKSDGAGMISDLLTLLVILYAVVRSVTFLRQPGVHLFCDERRNVWDIKQMLHAATASASLGADRGPRSISPAARPRRTQEPVRLRTTFIGKVVTRNVARACIRSGCSQAVHVRRV